jgi:hypothetical protein
MAANVMDSFINPLRAHFSDPVVSDEKLFYMYVAANLAEFEDTVLVEVQMRREIKGASPFLPLAECLEFHQKAKDTVERRKWVVEQKEAEARNPNALGMPSLSREEEAPREKFAGANSLPRRAGS